MRNRTGADLSACAECHAHEGDQTVLKTDHQCAACHTDIAARMADAPYRHPGMSPGEGETAACLDCHEFHGAGSKFLKADPIQLCGDARCHPRSLDAGSHPVGMTEAKTGRMMTCTSSCHDPHGTKEKFFCKAEPGRALCIGCHEDL